MEPKKENKTFFAKALAIIAGLALLMGNLETIQNFLCPNKKTCEEIVEKIRVKKVELENSDFQLLSEELINEIRQLVSKYFEVEDCNNPQTDSEINAIKLKLITLIDEDLNSLRKEFSEQIQSKLHSHIRLLDLICNLSNNCSEKEQSEIKELKKIIK